MAAMDCPRCGAPAVATPACPRCGVIVAKARPREERPRDAPSAVEPTETAGVSKVWAIVAGVAVLLGLAVYDRRTSPAVEAPAAATAATSSDPLPAGVPPPPAVAAATPPSLDERAMREEVKGLSPADRDQVDALVRHVARRGAMTATDVSGAEQLYAAHSTEPAIGDLLEAVLLSAAETDRKRRDFASAAARLRRAAEVRPGNARPQVALVAVLSDAGDWSGAEAAARAALRIDRGNVGVWQSLGYALLRLDRNREAAEALREALEVRDDAQTRALLARVESGMRAERGMTEQQLAHFHVRYDGGAHEGVGREILRALERHYATLTSTLDHRPAAPIPVILFSRQAYYDASGAPAWSGGAYDGLDGRIRIPIGGLTESLTPDMDGTLVHELTHAFVADRTKGLAPREIHEGLAQYMEGKRSADDASPQVLAALADGRIGGVGGYYLAALSYVEHLVAIRGMGGMNDLLRAMGETGDVDEAFRRVHGGTFHDSRVAWARRLRQEYGS
jgi:tetratricopeptide (TPR) repeat protein